MTMNLEIIHAVCVLWMTAIIGIVQFILYPAFAFIRETEFQKFHDLHSRRIAWLVAPAMLVQLFTAILLAAEESTARNIYYLVSVILIFIATGYFSIPYHSRLQNGYDVSAIEQLARKNWVRTALWTLESFVILLSLESLLPQH
jgi:hypothetical protein